tara:strand:+ start:10674 stop:11786 length:1113 start_codon:yes stop_codon:yes gene_type:complete
MNNFSFSSANELKNFLKDEKLKKIFIICGENSYKNSGADKLLDGIILNKQREFFFKKSPYPDLSELKKIITSIRNSSPDLIIAIGGGSVIDYAKIANVLTENNNLETEIPDGSYTIKKKFTKLAAIPTTAGSGAEVTSNAVIYIDKIKYSVEGEELKPDYFFLIPELVIGASNKIKSSAGFDAIAQAMESLVSRKSNEKSVEYAKKSLQISLEHYINFLNKPNNENTSAMCLAANLSGKAISISKTTAPHACSYPFTAIYNISHGHAVSLTLNKFFKFNYQNLKQKNCQFDLNQRFEDIFKICKVKDIQSFEQYFKRMMIEAKLENDLNKLGINIENDYSKIISGINILRLSNNPIDLNEEVIKNILFQK